MKKYEYIYQQISNQIKEEKIKAGSYLPTELQLTKEFQVSRDTVRKALARLAKEGYIKRKQGSGSLVLKHEQFSFPISDLTSYQELVKIQGIQSKTHVISVDKIIIDEELSELTNFPLHSHTWRIIRQRLVDSVAAVLDIDYLLLSIVPTMTREIAEKSIYAYLEGDLHLSISNAKKEITIDRTTDMDKLFLDLGNDHHIVRIQSKVYLTNKKQFQFTESRHKLDKFKFTDYAVRRQ